MIKSKAIIKEIYELTSKVIDSSITDKEKFPCMKNVQGYKVIGIEGVEDLSIALKKHEIQGVISSYF